MSKPSFCYFVVCPSLQSCVNTTKSKGEKNRYKSNFLNYINTTNPDNSGNLAWMIGELQDAEDKGERVWILGHVLTGWDGFNPLPNPTDYFYQVVARYSP